MMKRKNSIEDGDSSLSASQESLMSDDFFGELDMSSDKVWDFLPLTVF